MIVAVDGPAASGKGTLAKRLAARFGFAHLDTGLTYRAVARAMHDNGEDFDDVAAAVRTARTVDFAALDKASLLAPEVGEGASRVAVHPELRRVLVSEQRRFALGADKGAVLDGRDIGTVVFPDAAIKLFVTASLEERARRRALEVYGAGSGAHYEALLQSLKARDERDAGRTASPLRPAEDAHHLDTTDLSIDEALDVAVGLVENAQRA